MSYAKFGEQVFNMRFKYCANGLNRHMSCNFTVEKSKAD